MKFFSQTFLKGLAFLTPLFLTFYLIFWLYTGMEGILGSIIAPFFGDQWMFPGLGVLSTIVLVFLCGLFVSSYFTGKIAQLLTNRMSRIPVIRSIYGPLKDLIALVSKSSLDSQASRVVFIRAWEQGPFVLGLLTQEKMEAVLGEETPEEELVSVYVPMSYMVGGVTYLVKRKDVVPTNIPVERALKLSLTGYLGRGTS